MKMENVGSAIAFTNGNAIREGIIPCETNPNTGALSRTSEPFHSRAEYTIGKNNGVRRHVCVFCRGKYHPTAPSVAEIVF